MAFRKKNCFRIVDRSSGRKILRVVGQVITNKVRNLLALNVNYSKTLTLLQYKRNTTSRRNDVQMFHAECVKDTASWHYIVARYTDKLLKFCQNP